MSEVYKLVIYGRPIVKKNNQRVVTIPAYRTKNGKAFAKKINTKAYKEWYKSATLQIPSYPKIDKPIDYPVNMKCIFYRPTLGRVDLSALYESPQDFLSDIGILEDDNYKIVAGHDGSRVRIDRENPRTEITFTRLSESEL